MVVSIVMALSAVKLPGVRKHRTRFLQRPQPNQRTFGTDVTVKSFSLLLDESSRLMDASRLVVGAVVTGIGYACVRLFAG